MADMNGAISGAIIGDAIPMNGAMNGEEAGPIRGAMNGAISGAHGNDAPNPNGTVACPPGIQFRGSNIAAGTAAGPKSDWIG